MTQLELVQALKTVSTEEIAASLVRLIKRTLVEESLPPSGGVEYTHTILLFSHWLAVSAPSIENERV